MEVVNKCSVMYGQQTMEQILLSYKLWWTANGNKFCCLSGTGTNPIVTCVYLDKRLNRPILIHIPQVLQRLNELEIVLAPRIIYRLFPHYPGGKSIQCVAFFKVVLPNRPTYPLQNTKVISMKVTLFLSEPLHTPGER